MEYSVYKYADDELKRIGKSFIGIIFLSAHSAHSDSVTD